MKEWISGLQSDACCRKLKKASPVKYGENSAKLLIHNQKQIYEKLKITDNMASAIRKEAKILCTAESTQL